MASIHSPLQGEGREFRLLTLEPSTDCLNPLRCELNQASFDDGDLKYTALSYTWGDPLDTTPILVNGVKTQVTLNLEAALRHIRQASHTVALWVDVLCINQKDTAEKNHQVEMMREIFAGAELVIAWLGSAGEDSDIAMELFAKEEALMDSERSKYKRVEEGMGSKGSSIIIDEQGGNAPMRRDKGDLTTTSAQFASSEPVKTMTDIQFSSPLTSTNFGTTRALSGIPDKHQDEHHFPEHSGNPSVSQHSGSRSDSDKSSRQPVREELLDLERERCLRRQALAVTKLLGRPWWSRIWVVQEVLLARKVVFKCGDAEVPGEQLARYTQQKGFLPSLHTLGNDLICTIQLLSVFNLLDRLTPLEELSGDADDCLVHYGRRQATRPHDHIYGILGIIPEKDRILIGATDYNCKVENLFIHVAVKLMVGHNSLGLLCSAGLPAPSTATSSTEMDLPSWVPDWTRPRMSNFGLAAHVIPFSSEPEFHFSQDFTELMLNCTEFDKIESVKLLPALAQGKMPLWQSAPEEERRRDDQRPPPLQKVIVALFTEPKQSDCLEDDVGFAWVVGFFQELEEYRVSLGRDQASDTPDKADYLAGFLDWISEIRDERTDEEILEKVFSVQAAQNFVAWYHKQSKADLQRFYKIYSFLRAIFSDVSMFRTCKGFFGILPAGAAPGDTLCVVPTCSTPLVLRKVQPSKYMLVGPTAPIAGTMHGELAQAEENGEIMKELFTLI